MRRASGCGFASRIASGGFTSRAGRCVRGGSVRYLDADKNQRELGVDPYYLSYKAETAGYHPEVILAGRRINEGMGKFIAEKTVKLMIRAGSSIKGARVNVLGLTFKEDCADLRNSKVIDIIRELQSYGIEVGVHDPSAEAAEARHAYAVELLAWDKLPRAGAVVLAVAHKEYKALAMADFATVVKHGGALIDVKSVLDSAGGSAAAYAIWRL